MNVVINAHASARPSQLQPGEVPVIAVLGLRVRDAAAAYKRALDRGAWAVPVQVDVMEPHIPAIHGVGATRIYFVDRTEAFSIWDVDFVPIPTVDRHPGATPGCTGSASCSTSAPIAWTTGASSTASASASTSRPTNSASASCPRAAS